MPDEYIPPGGNLCALEFSGEGFVPPSGNLVALEFATASPPAPGDDQYVFPQSFDSASFGVAYTWNYHGFLSPDGIPPGTFGSHRVWNYHGFVRPAGVYTQSVGTPWVSNKIRHIGQAGNIRPTLAFGVPHVENLDRSVRPVGIAGTAFGAAFVSQVERFVHPSPVPPVLNNGFGTAWVEFGERRIVVMEGIDGARFGLPALGKTQVIGAEGWDSQRFGTRIVPEITHVYPRGWDAQYGLPEVFNARKQVFPAGMSWPENFGTATVYNARQYIGHHNDGDSQCLGEVFGHWTKIENRNREIHIHGHDSAKLPRQYVTWGARRIDPDPFPEQGGVGKPFISHWIRFLYPEGMAPTYIGSWNAVRNGAWVYETRGKDHQAFGTPSLANTRRTYRWIGNWDSQEFGDAFVDFASREIVIEKRYSIDAPPIPLPYVGLGSRYVENASLSDVSRFGIPSLEIHWTKFLPSGWNGMRHGMPSVRNLTPELLARGRNHEEFGVPEIGLYTRYLKPDGYSQTLFGTHAIRDRRTWVNGNGFNAQAFGVTQIRNQLPDPPGIQRVMPGSIPAVGDEYKLFGIPNLNRREIHQAETPVQSRFGEARVIGSVIYPIGMYDFHAFGTPDVSLYRRTVSVEGIDAAIVCGKPRINPHTIWANFSDVTEQAIYNHDGKIFIPVDTDEMGMPLRGVGHPVVSNRYQLIRLPGFAAGPHFGLTELDTRRHYIHPKGWRLSRVGWHEVSGPPREIEVYDAQEFSAFGAHTVHFPPYTGPRTISPQGFSGAFGTTRVENFNRDVSISGWNSMAMGASGDGPRHMRQRLWVGPPDWPAMHGFDASAIGEAWVSFRVREVITEGWLDEVMDYDLQHFEWRTHIKRSGEATGNAPGIPPAPAAWNIRPEGMAPPPLGTPDIGNRVQYIQQDGAADQSRKGVPLWPH
jgi:hypothetical protein